MFTMIHNRQHQQDLHIKPGKSEVTCVGQLLCKLLMLLERIQMKMVMMMVMKNHQKRTKGPQITLGRPRCAPSARVPGKKQTCLYESYQYLPEQQFALVVFILTSSSIFGLKSLPPPRISPTKRRLLGTVLATSLLITCQSLGQTVEKVAISPPP